MMRVHWLAIGAVVVVGCESLRTVPAEPLAASPHEFATRGVASGSAPPLPTDSLTLAAESLERGDQAAAAHHLGDYVRSHPEQLMFRAQLAEMLIRLGRDEEAKIHFERFAADAQTATGPPQDHLVHVHTRLMEIAQRTGDGFGVAYHRGVGLLLLLKEQDNTPGRDAGFCEQMLCQSLKALSRAKELEPGDPRPRVYLAEVYDRMGNRRAADAERAVARNGVVAGALTTTEQNRLWLSRASGGRLPPE